MIITVFTENLKDAISLASFLGKIDNTISGPLDINNINEEDIETFLENTKDIGFFKTYTDVHEYIFTWLAETDIKLSLNKTESYLTPNDELTYEILNEKQAEIVRNIFNNKNYNRIYNTTSRSHFARVYSYTNAKKDFNYLTITQLNEEDVLKAFNEPLGKEESFNDFIAELTYQKMYWLSDNNINVALRNTLKKPVSLSYRAIVLLRLLVQRHDLIINFKGETAYALLGNFITSSGEKFSGNSQAIEFNSKQQAQKYISTLPRIAIVNKYEVKKVSEQIIGPLDYASCVKMVSKEFGYTQDQTKKSLIELFERGFITSPNTSSRTFPRGNQKDLIKTLVAFKNTRTFANQLQSFEDGDFEIPLHMISQDDNIGILPTANIIKNPYSKEMLDIYTIICRETLKAVLPPHVTKKYKVTVVADKLQFSLTGTTLLSKGYMALAKEKPYMNDVPSNIEIGDALKASYSVRTIQKSSKPHYSEKEIITLLPSHSETVDEVKETGLLLRELSDNALIQKKKMAILPTEKGISLIHTLLPVDDLFSLSNLALWENEIKKIRISEKTSKAETLSINTVNTFSQNLKEWCEKIESSMGALTTIPCPTCNAALKKSADKYFCTLCGFSTNTIHQGKIITDNQLKYILKFKSSPISSGFVNGKGRLFIDENNIIRFSEYTKENCPICKSSPMKIDNRKKSLICENSTCGFSIAFRVLGHEFTHNDFAELLSSYKTSILDGININGEACQGFFFISKDKNIKFKKY